MRVLVTGANAHLARALLPRLLAWPGVEEVVGLDWSNSVYPHPRYRAVRADIRDPGVAEHLEGIDVVIHMAFIVLGQALGRNRKERNLMRSINLEGSRNLFSAAREAGVAHVIYPSSVAVYGVWPDNPVPLTEDSPRRPVPGFGYSEDKAGVEFWLDSYEREPGPVVTRLRMHAIVGPNAQPLLNQIAQIPFYFRTRGDPPLAQCLWEEDAVDAILRALETRQSGAFNIAAFDPLPWRELVARHHRLPLALPFGAADRAHKLLWQVSGRVGDPGWMEGMRHSLVVDCTRADEVLDWRANYSVADCVDLCWSIC